MTEKEFIVKFIEYVDNEKWRGIIPNYDAIDEWLDEWLKEHHKEYFEVEFIRAGCELDNLGIAQHTKACQNDCVYKSP